MAQFNPGVQPGNADMPNWTNVTKPVASFEADKSTGIALETTGKAIEGIAQLADTTAKDIIKKDTKDTVEPIREDFTNSLIAARDQANSSVVPAPVQTGSGSTATNILPDQQSSVQPPNAVQTGLQKVQAIQLAQENGKVNDTYYDMTLKNAVTGLRSKYPGYTDYIDSEVSKITGINPANALVQNLMQDINRLQTNKKTAADALMNEVMKSGYPDSQMMMQKLQANPNDANTISDVRAWYAKQTTFDSQIKRQDAIRNSTKGQREDVSEQRTSDFNNVLAANMSTDFDKLTTIPGMTTAKVLDTMADAAANPGKYDDAQLRQLAVSVSAMKAQYIAKAQAAARAVSKDDQGRSYSYYGDVGNAKIDAAIESQAKVYDNISDALTKGGPNGIGVAFSQAIHAKAILDGSKDRLLSDKDIGVFAQDWSASNELFGPNWTNTAFLSGLKGDVDTKMAAYTQTRMQQARLNKDSNGNPVNITQHMEEAKRLESEGKINGAMRARYTNNLINIVDDIKNKEAPMPAKENVVKYLFSPEGQGILNGIKTDYTDPNTGKFVPGKYSVFQRLTSDDVVSEVKKMAPQYQQMYKGYLEREAGAQLFQKEFLNLNHYTGVDDIHFKYNDGDGTRPPQIEVLSDKKPQKASITGVPSMNAPVNAGYQYQIEKTVNRVNDALAGMYRVEKGFDGDVNSYVLDFLANKSQVDIGKNWEGLPKKIIDAIAASRAPARKIEDTFKNLGNN